jgi:hypothetical protein
VTTDREGQQLPIFTMASQNMAAVTALLDTLPVPSTNGVGKVYQQLKNILGTAVTQQVESSLKHRVKVSILTLDHSNTEGGATGHAGSTKGRNDLLTGNFWPTTG